MTYRAIRERLHRLTDEQLDSDATLVLLNTGEAVPIIDFVGKWSELDREKNSVGLDLVDSVLDTDHPFLTVDA